MKEHLKKCETKRNKSGTKWNDFATKWNKVGTFFTKRYDSIAVWSFEKPPKEKKEDLIKKLLQKEWSKDYSFFIENGSNWKLERRGGVMAKLTPKQKRFCEEYLIDLNATQGAIRAGYSP